MGSYAFPEIETLFRKNYNNYNRYLMLIIPKTIVLLLQYIIKTNSAILSDKFIKYYTYNDDNTTVSKSELIKEKNPFQDPPQETPYHFAMVKYTKPTITITSLQEDQLSPNLDKPPNPDNPLYSITITKGTKI